VEAASSPEELRANIDAAWGQLPTDQLARMIELVLLAAELAGMYDARNTSPRDVAPSPVYGGGLGGGKGQGRHPG